MATATQQTSLFTYDEANSSVVEIGTPTSISGAGSTNSQIDITSLSDTARQYIPGLSEPGEVTFDINFDSSDDSHLLLETMRKNRVVADWAIGFSDGSAAPTYSIDAFSFTARSNIQFKGFVTSVQFSFEQNSAVSASIGIQITGDVAVEAAA